MTNDKQLLKHLLNEHPNPPKGSVIAETIADLKRKVKKGKYIVVDQEGNALYFDNLNQVRKFIRVSTNRASDALKKGYELKGYTIDETIKDDEY